MKSTNILEIGALDSPTLNPSHYSVKFLDFASAEDLSKKSSGNPRYKIENLVKVDFVCPTINYSDIVSEKFDLIIANHVIEHVIDTIKWLNEISNLLTPEGTLFLSVPDKRYTFDIMRNNTTFIDLIRINDFKINKPTKYHILERFYYHKNIKAEEVRNNTHLSKLDKKRFTPKDAFNLVEKLSLLDYTDVHCHVYTKTSFEHFMN